MTTTTKTTTTKKPVRATSTPTTGAPKRAPAAKKAAAKSTTYGVDEQSFVYAADRGDCAALRGLLARGVSPNARDPRTGYTALHYAALQGRTEAVELLLAAGADVGARILRSRTTPLDGAVRGNHVEVVEKLLAAGSPLVDKGRVGWTALHSAATSGYKEILQMLLSAGMDVDTVNQHGMTPLGMAIGDERGQRVLPMLFEAGADLNKLPKTLFSLLTSDERYASIRPLLYKHGLPKPEKKKPPKRTPLHKAAARGEVEVVKRLLADGADVNAELPDVGTTPLHLAAIGNHVGVLEVLHKAGASLNAGHAPYGWTALEEAVSHGRKEATKWLLDAGMAATTELLFTALAFKVAWPLFPMLIEAGADPGRVAQAVKYDAKFASLRPLFQPYLKKGRKKK